MTEQQAAIGQRAGHVQYLFLPVAKALLQVSTIAYSSFLFFLSQQSCL